MRKPSANPARSRSGQSAATAETFPDQSYLAFLRPVPRPFLRFTSGHFPTGTRTTPHSHPCLALHGCLQGPLTLVTPEAEHALDSGVFYLIPPGVRHHWVSTGRQTAATLGLLIDADQPGQWPQPSGVATGCRRLQQLAVGLRRFSVVGDRDLQHSFWLAADHLTAEQAREPLVTTGVLLTLLGQIIERLESAPAARPPREDIAQQIRRLLLLHVHEQLSIDEIARQISVSPTRAKQAFRQAFGCGIIAYFNQLKIWQAKRLLCDASLSIQQVSDHLGFASPAYFCRVFVQQAGETPSDFRRSAIDDLAAADRAPPPP